MHIYIVYMKNLELNESINVIFQHSYIQTKLNIHGFQNLAMNTDKGNKRSKKLFVQVSYLIKNDELMSTEHVDHFAMHPM